MPKPKSINKKKSVTFRLQDRNRNTDKNVWIPVPIAENTEERDELIEIQNKFLEDLNSNTNKKNFHVKEERDCEPEWPSLGESLSGSQAKSERLGAFEELEDDFIDLAEGVVENEAEYLNGSDTELDEFFDNFVGKSDGHGSNEVEMMGGEDGELDGFFDNFIKSAGGVISNEDEEFEDPDDELENFCQDFNKKSDDEAEGIYEDLDDEFDGVVSDEETLTGDDCSDQDMTSFSPLKPCIKRDFSTYSYNNVHQEIATKQMERIIEEYDNLAASSNDYVESEGMSEAQTEEFLKMGEEFLQENRAVKLERDAEVAEITKNLARRKNAFKTEYVEYEEEEKPKYDCQSIISTYYRNRHMPTVIEIPAKPKKIKINPKTGIPKNVLGQHKLTGTKLEKHNENLGNIPGGEAQTVHTMVSKLSALSIRNKDETLEEKRERKKALKEFRKERRVEKKCNKLTFSAEKQKLLRARSGTTGVTMGRK